MKFEISNERSKLSSSIQNAEASLLGAPVDGVYTVP